MGSFDSFVVSFVWGSLGFGALEFPFSIRCFFVVIYVLTANITGIILFSFLNIVLSLYQNCYIDITITIIINNDT